MTRPARLRLFLLGPLRSDAITDDQEKTVQTISPIAAAYRATREMMIQLFVFGNKLDMAVERLAPGGGSKEWVSAIDPITADFITNYRPELVRVREKLKSDFGLIRPELSDEMLSKDFYSPNELKQMAFGLESILSDLSQKIVAKAADL